MRKYWRSTWGAVDIDWRESLIRCVERSNRLFSERRSPWADVFQESRMREKYPNYYKR